MLSGKTALGQAQAAAGYSAPVLPFASFPAALSADGQILRPAEVPHVSLIALGGIWRPLGGRQVLAQRHTNPPTVQSLSLQIAEVVGTFPGGLVRNGMRLNMDMLIGHGALTSTARVAAAYINGSRFAQAQDGSNGIVRAFPVRGLLIARGDGAGPHPGWPTSLSAGYGAGTYEDRNVDFSQDFTVDIRLQSASEASSTIVAATWAAGFATYTTSGTHQLSVNDKTTIASITPTGWNGVFVVDTVISTTQFKVPMEADPGAYTSGGTSSRISNVRPESYVLALEG